MPLLRLCLATVLGAIIASSVLLQQCDARAPEHRFKVVLIAGDGSLPVFDNAVRGVESRIAEDPSDTARLSASRGRRSTLAHVLASVAAMHPAAGQGCFVFATSHGAHHDGLWLSTADEYLSPAALDRALTTGCGDAPTAVVISSCFSGSFAKPPMARPNRVILTAARPDRASFGCGAGRAYTVYDKCLLDALDAGGTWRGAYASIRSCVRQEERREDEKPSEPQAWFGANVADMALPPRTGAHPEASQLEAR